MIRPLEILINQTLSLDPKASQFLKKLQGKKIEININLSYSSKNFFIQFSPLGIKCLHLTFSSSDAIIRGPLHAYLHFARTRDPRGAAECGLSFTGDPETLETLQSLCSNLNIDWEEYLSQWTGDIFAHQIGTILRSAKRSQQVLLDNTQHSIAEYLTEEIKVLPTRGEVEEFLNNVDVLRANTERLLLRMDEFMQKQPRELQ